MSVDEMHDNIGVGKLSDRRDLHLCGLMYKRSKDVDYVDARNLPTRQFDKLVLKIPDVVLTKTFKGSTLWNGLPIEIQHCPTYKEFKFRYRNRIQNYLL